MFGSVASAFRRNVVMAAAMMLAATGAFAQGSADTAAIAKVRSAFEKAAAAQDGPAIAKLFAADGAEMMPYAPAAKGHAAIEALHKAFGQQFMVHGFTVTPTETKVIGDVAYEVGTYKQSLMAMTGGGMSDDKGKYIVLLKKDASGAWVITHAMYNTDIPLPAPKK